MERVERIQVGDSLAGAVEKVSPEEEGRYYATRSKVISQKLKTTARNC